MSFRTELAKIALQQINDNMLVQFDEMTTNIDLFETAVAEYDGVILQLLFPNPTAGYLKFQLLKTDITLAEPTSYLTNKYAETDLTIQEVIEIMNNYIREVNQKYSQNK